MNVIHVCMNRVHVCMNHFHIAVAGVYLVTFILVNVLVVGAMSARIHPVLSWLILGGLSW